MKTENQWVQQTHSLAHIHRHALTPPSPPHTQDLGERRGKGDSTGIHSIKLEITTLIENKKMGGGGGGEERKRKKEKKKKKKKKRKEAVIAQRKLYIRIHSVNFKKCAKFANNHFFLLQKRL